jgi:hypothetical protein
MSNRNPKPPSALKSEVTVDKEITVQAARAAIAQERQQRALDCSRELNAILKKYNCDLIAAPMFTKDGTVVAQAQIIAKE